jgi:hypothetical protein
MNKTKLTVQSCGGDKTKFRFGFSIDDSNKIKERKVEIKIIINGIQFISKTTCGQWRINENGEMIFYKGFDLYSKEISGFIIENKLNEYKKGKPTKKVVYYEIL